MNERIEELAEQARSWAETAYKQQNDQFTSHWDTPIGYTPSQFFEQKFAELIVEEYIGILETEIELVKGYKSTACNDFDVRWHEGKIEHFTKLIEKSKKHFGVEE
jgi:hypothetical protein